MTSMLTDDASQIQEALARRWHWLLAAGIVAIVAGTIAILVPAVASVGIAAFVGVLLLVLGVAMLIDAFSGRGVWRVVLRLLLAGIYVVAGIWLLAAPLEGTITLTFVLIVWFWVDGVMKIVAGIAGRGTHGAGWTIANGVLALLLGILIWADFPSSAEWAIGLLVGIDMLFFGVGAVAAALAARKSAATLQPPTLRPA